jgi:glucosamine--fructose-6-phosphate aminotransferase (isomerizing)
VKVSGGGVRGPRETVKVSGGGVVNLFLEEIRSQPEVLARRLDQGWAAVEEVAARLRRERPAALMVAARGSSDHAATYAKYLFEIRNRIPVALAAPSAFTVYGSPPRLAGLAVLAISQSGASPDVAAVVEEARRQGRPAFALVNDARSRLGRAAEVVIPMGAGRERSVPASKTYTSSLLCLAMLSCALDPDPAFRAAIEAVPAAVAEALASGAGRLADGVEGRRLAVIGRGYQLATAQEVALKVTETSYLLAEARSVADFMHGPIAAVDPELPVLLLEAGGPALADMRRLEKRLESDGACLLRIGDTLRPDARSVRVRTGLPESLTPIPFAAAGQLFAHALAARRGLDPDRPRGLRKITETT